MKKVEELEAPKICPFRTEIHYEYADLGGGTVVVDNQTETFPECYRSQCPLYKYDVEEGFHCTQADALGGNIEEEE